MRVLELPVITYEHKDNRLGLSCYPQLKTHLSNNLKLDQTNLISSKFNTNEYFGLYSRFRVV